MEILACSSDYEKISKTEKWKEMPKKLVLKITDHLMKFYRNDAIHIKTA